ncbi:MAG TPA: Rdx family protein [Thermoplasmata archaeon]|nr:Rdx family protein [Thermoplasmata archaeon]
MSEVTITYCVPCRYQFKAIQDADAILREFGQGLSALRLIPGDHGIYDVAVDGDVLFSLDKAKHFPETRELLEKIRAKIGSPGKRRAKS